MCFSSCLFLLNVYGVLNINIKRVLKSSEKLRVWGKIKENVNSFIPYLLLKKEKYQ